MMEMDMSEVAPVRSSIFRAFQARRAEAAPLRGLMTVPLRWVSRALARHRDERLLQAMSDAQLRDLGIARHQIPHVVRDGLAR
jgi:uncharacterized protein YjiS (DUF1127 family)